MSRRKIKAGSTSQTVPIFVRDTSNTVGAGLGSLVYNTSGLAAKYRREGQSSWTAISLATATLGTWTSGGFIADGGPITGGYEIGIPNAVLASGATWAEIMVYGATNMLGVLIEIELDAIDYQVAVAPASATTAIKAKTDQLTFTNPNSVDATANATLSPSDIADIASQIVADLQNVDVTLQSPVLTESQIDIVRDADFSAADGMGLEWTFTGKSFTPSAATLTIANKGISKSFAGTVSESSGSGSSSFHVSVELDRATLALIPAGSGTFDLFATVGARQVPLIAEGRATIRQRL